ncbi:hypothetical protein JCM19232_2618 [Vibrio ishigakensis]|uniref:Uncharacterized protein n=1 Tax=Vibrio ishigakensis TaxID=1481914 RepID=A0A0B8PKJ7_9VIBR|nr:hypothetical protein JCM19232_2618 [Vibrio ishigakensis]
MKYFLVEVKPVVKYMKDYDDSLINHTESFYTQQKTAVAAKYVGSERVLGLTPKTDSEGNKLWKDPKATQVSEEEFIAHYEETQEQLPDLPQQESIDVAVIKLSETRRIEVAVREVGKDWLSSLELIDISEPSISEGNIRKFSDAKPNKEESVKSVMSKAGDLLFKLGDIPGGKHFYTGNLQEKFDIAVDYQIVVDIEPNESESSDFIPTDPYQKVIYNCLFCIDDAHLEFTEEQYQEAGANLETVIKEHQKHTKGFLTDATIEDLQKIDWDSGAEAQKTFLNIRHLRAK